MISHLSHASVFVLDQDSAKAFYTEKLGFEVRDDITMGEEFEGNLISLTQPFDFDPQAMSSP